MTNTPHLYKKHLLSKTKQDFVQWLAGQPENMKWIALTTSFTANTQFARFRRLYVKTLNDINLRGLRS